MRPVVEDEGERPDTRPGATTLPGFTDAHVHLGLVDPVALRAGGLARVVDLGWEPAVVADWIRPSSPDRPAAHAGDGALSDPARLLPRIAVAGGLLGAPGGYPSRAAWAPSGAAVPVADEQAGREAVLAMAALGARVVKVTVNTDAGPVWGDRLFAAVVAAAHEQGLPVAAHVQGVGQAARALDAGVDVLAHTPWSERLDDGLVARLAERTTWISTLDIHGRGRSRRNRAHRIAVDNLRRFHRAGGDVRYGTDLGNGDLPLGVNRRELAALAGAGLDGTALVAALTTGTRGRWDPFGGSAGADALVSVLPGPMPAGDAADVIDWLCRAVVVDTAHAHQHQHQHQQSTGHHDQDGPPR